MELKIDAEAINKMVAEEVLKSAIGESLKRAIEKEIEKLGSHYNNPLETVVRQYVTAKARDVLEKEHGEAIREKLSEYLAAFLSQEFVNRVCEKALERF